MKKYLGIVIAGLLISSAAHAAIECTMEKLVRKIEVVYTEAGKKAPCVVKYTKEDGTTKDVANAAAQEGVCEEKAKIVSDKLTGYGWKCEAK